MVSATGGKVGKSGGAAMIAKKARAELAPTLQAIDAHLDRRQRRVIERARAAGLIDDAMAAPFTGD
jgi:hypothetical protein